MTFNSIIIRLGTNKPIHSMSMHIFLENILEMFLKEEKPKSLEEKEVLQEISILVTVIISSRKPYETESNQIYSAFNRLQPYLPSGIDPEELRILCNLCYMGKLVNITDTEEWIISETPPTPTPTPRGYSFYDPRYRDAYGKGFRDLITQGAETVGPGEVKIFFPK